MMLGIDTSVTTTDLIGLARWYTNTDENQFSAAEVKGLLNRAQHELNMRILESMDSWDFNGQTATASLVAGQREYSWPTDLLKIKRIDAQLDGTNWFRLDAFDSQTHPQPLSNETDIRGFFTTRGAKYDAFDDHFRILSGGAIISVTDGIYIEYTQEITELSATTDEPQFVEGFQPWLALWAAKSYFNRYEQPRKGSAIAGEMQEIEERIRDYYSRRNQDHSQRARMSTRRSSWHYT